MPLFFCSAADIADAVARGLLDAAGEHDAAQAVYSIDAVDELGLHPYLHASLREGGYGVWPEQRYPGHWHKAKRSEGLRCDFVITPGGRPLEDPAAADTLFASAGVVAPEAAYWLEVKTVSQFTPDGPFRRYSTELLSPVTQDVKKLYSDPVIQHAGLLLVLFTRDRDTAERDLVAWHTRCIDRGYPAGPPATRGFALNDRIGNAWCTAAVFGVKGV